MPRKKKEKLDPYHWHEALDRTLMFYEMIDAQLMTHPVVQQNPIIKRHVRASMEKLMEAYMKIGTSDLHPIFKSE